MKCCSVRKKLSTYQDRELKPLEREEISRHLQGCHSCREAYENLERVWQTLGGLEEITPGPWFYPQLVRKLKEARKRISLPTLQHVFRFIGAPAVTSIILVIGLVAGSYLGSNLVRRDLFPSQSIPVSDSQSDFFTSMRVFDPAPPGTFAEGYFRMASYEESGSR